MLLWCSCFADIGAEPTLHKLLRRGKAAFIGTVLCEGRLPCDKL